MMPNLHRVLYSSHTQPCESKWSSTLLHQSCIMRTCFKWYSTVAPIGADSYIKRRALCISVVIRYAFHMQTSSSVALCGFSGSHIPSHCVLKCTIFCLCSPLFMIMLPVLVQKCPDWKSDGEELLIHSLLLQFYRFFYKITGQTDEMKMPLHPSVLHHSFSFVWSKLHHV